MSNKDAFEDRKRAQEEEYFRKQDQKNIENMRRNTALEAERREMADVLGVGEEKVLHELQELGFTRETALLVYVAPLVQVAWAEGRLTERERELILTAARSRGISEGSPADLQLAAWLDSTPGEIFFEKILRVIGALLQTLPPDQREAQKREILAGCARIAEASGGILGFGNKVSKDEQDIVARISAELERSPEM